jgi:hypothetical protein
MILQPGIIALVLGSGTTLVLLTYASFLGVKILMRWDMGNSSEEQLSLERKTYLVSTLVRYGLAFEILSVFLFIYTADDLHNLLVGAMCATGSLNANSFGFPTLYAKIAVFFLASAWIALDSLDNRAEDYPLTRKKYTLLLFVVPAVWAGYVLQILYFSHIDPSVITSCCGVLFSEGGTNIGSSLASLPVHQTEFVFFGMFATVVAFGLAVIMSGRRSFIVPFSILSALFFGISTTSIVSFISLYFYQIPTHHCPFDMLQADYYYSGYPLYFSLFSGSFFGAMTGVIEPLKKIRTLSLIVPAAQRRWAVIAVLCLAIFVLISLVPMVFTSFTLEGY